MNIENYDSRRIVVIGANGGIGKRTVEQALEQGRAVIALVRNPQRLGLNHPRLTIQKGDVTHYETLAGIFKPEDIVISAIGKNSTKETTLYSRGNHHVIQAMMQAGATRLFVVSASGLVVNPTHNLWIRWITKNILQRILKHMYTDLLRMEKMVKSTSLNWTIVRPPRLTNEARTGRYRIAIDDVVSNGQKIARADVADFVLNNIDNADTIRKTVELGY